jgi:hypothetical protein
MNNGNALAIVKAAQNKGALVFTNIENFEAQVDLYRTEVTQMTFRQEDFHNIGGKYMPNKAATDRIGEACGVQFIQSACRVTVETYDDPLCGKRTVYRAEAQGKVRMPDGSWRTSTVDEYEFDPVLRAMLDKNIIELNEQTKKTVGRTILEYTKVARQRAATGARLRVIRQLTGMPAAFEKADATKPFVFTRIVQNTSYILQTPEGRAMATAQALGVDVTALFGGRKTAIEAPIPQEGGDDDQPFPHEHTTTSAVDEPQGSDNEPHISNAERLAGEAACGDDELAFGDDEDGGAQDKQPENEFDHLTASLEEYLTFKEYLDITAKNGVNPYELAEKELNDKAATVESRTKMIERVKNFLIASHVKGVA